jgi:hypothetical protein
VCTAEDLRSKRRRERVVYQKAYIVSHSNQQTTCRKYGVTLGRISAMNRWLLIGSLAALLVGSTGCFQQNVRSNCANGACPDGSCNECGGTGHVGAMKQLCGACGGNGGCRTGCQTGKLGWQQGGLDYSSHLNPGPLGHNAARNLNSRPMAAGPPTGQVGYPYYTVRGPRDFLVDNPPTIGR